MSFTLNIVLKICFQSTTNLIYLSEISDIYIIVVFNRYEILGIKLMQIPKHANGPGIYLPAIAHSLQ